MWTRCLTSGVHRIWQGHIHTHQNSVWITNKDAFIFFWGETLLNFAPSVATFKILIDLSFFKNADIFFFKAKSCRIFGLIKSADRPNVSFWRLSDFPLSFHLKSSKFAPGSETEVQFFVRNCSSFDSGFVKFLIPPAEGFWFHKIFVYIRIAWDSGH